MVAIIGHLTRVIAGIPVPNSPIVNASIELAFNSQPSYTYNHAMRTWLNGQAIINKLPSVNRSLVDEEAFAVAAILHDIGWHQDPEFSTPDKRFEVDGADVARSFVQREGGSSWTKERQRVIWDAIALHGIGNIANYKDFEVKLVTLSALLEWQGIDSAKGIYGDLITVTQSEWDQIAQEFPRAGSLLFFRELMIDLCRKKPATTYDNFVGDWGEKYLANYSRIGHRAIDFAESTPE
ncbi:hypothetical protein DM02DRAFT_554120 [Periconia macrospinosa]|uniref:HD domain-containing protein n=1 Tax=Periconia macrospinosa TaxID=97972 RepID=A0A2V1E5K7_9PLEO|nr:hypothetical protein DM02DRAFT_554120 [Periconia macrospinosa]